jgi:hypothetical protein
MHRTRVKIGGLLFHCWLILRPWKWRPHIPPKCRFTFNGIHGVIFHNIVSSIRDVYQQRKVIQNRRESTSKICVGLSQVYLPSFPCRIYCLASLQAASKIICLQKTQQLRARLLLNKHIFKFTFSAWLNPKQTLNLQWNQTLLLKY